jgi:hypothetical protein
VRARLVWTGHVYVPKGADPRPHTAKLDVDLALSEELALPFVLGEIGQHVPNVKPRPCADGVAHDMTELFRGVLEATPQTTKRSAIDAAMVWGEGECALTVHAGDANERAFTVGVGGDSADIPPSDRASRDALSRARAEPRFVTF